MVSFEAPPELIEQVDEAARREERSRSGWLRHWVATIVGQAEDPQSTEERELKEA